MQMKRKDGIPKDHSFGYQKTRQVFTEEIEGELVDYLIAASKIFNGLRTEELRELAYKLTDSNTAPMPDEWKENRKAGIDLVITADISLRSPKATSLQTNDTMRQSRRRNEEKFTPDNMWNIDETGVTTVQAPTKQIAKKGEQRVGAVVAQERGTLVAEYCGIRASGNHIPPFLVFPRVNAQDHWRLTLSPGTQRQQAG